MSLSKKIKNSQGTKTNIRGFWVVFLILVFCLLAAFYYGDWHKNPKILAFYEQYFGSTGQVEKTVSSVKEAAQKKAEALEKKAKETAQSAKETAQSAKDKVVEKAKETIKVAGEKAEKIAEAVKSKPTEKPVAKVTEKKTVAKVEEKPAKKPVFQGTDIKAGGGSKIMGFAPPGWSVMLKSGKDIVGSTVANSKDGRWVILPNSKQLSRGEKVLELVTVSPNKKKQLKSDQKLAVIIPKTRNAKAKVMRQESGKPIEILQEGELHLDKPKKVVKKEEPKVVKTEKKLENSKKVTTVNADLLALGNFDYKIGNTDLSKKRKDPSSFSLDGESSPNGKINIYLNNEKIGTVQANDKGKWSFDKKFALVGKKQTIKVEQLGTDGKVLGTREKMFRTEIPVATRTFDKEAFKVKTDTNAVKKDRDSAKKQTVAKASNDSGEPQTLLKTGSVGNRPETVIVVIGDTLWGLAVTYYGDGYKYKKIYSANQNQIKNPHWIYPGQNLKLP